MVYQWKTAACIKADVQAAGEQFEMLERTVGLTAENVLEANRAEETPLHDEFEWQDDVAAEKYRLHQAGNLIRFICIASETEQQSIPIRAFLKTEAAQPYKSLNVIMQSADDYAAMLDRARRELAAFKNKYQALTELKPVFDAISGLESEGK